ncbi:MAG: DUF2177 family protein [Gammaproteobacteria bacterium]
MLLHYLKLFGAIIVIFFVLDMFWLGFLGKNLYFSAYGDLLRQQNGSLVPSWPAAILVYILFALGIILFVVKQTDGTMLNGLLWGGLLGLVIYGIYDLTNYAVFANWPLNIIIIDIIWGTILCGVTSSIACKLHTMWLS